MSSGKKVLPKSSQSKRAAVKRDIFTVFHKEKRTFYSMIFSSSWWCTAFWIQLHQTFSKSKVSKLPYALRKVKTLKLFPHRLSPIISVKMIFGTCKYVRSRYDSFIETCAIFGHLKRSKFIDRADRTIIKANELLCPFKNQYQKCDDMDFMKNKKYFGFFLFL